MDAKTKLIEIANEIKGKSNTNLANWTAEEIMGKALVEGICYYRSPSYRKSIFIKRTGKTIVVTDKETKETTEIVDGRGVAKVVETETEIARIDL